MILLQLMEALINLDLSTIIIAVIGLFSGGAILKLYESWKSKRDSDRKHSEEPEQYIRDLLSVQVTELSSKVDVMQARMEELLVSEARTTSENRALIKDNNELKRINNELIKTNNELLKMNRQFLIKIDELTSSE